MFRYLACTLWACLADPAFKFTESEERAFVASLQRDLVWAILAASAVYTVRSIWAGVPTFFGERARADNPFMWALKDPRTTWMFAVVLSITFGVMGVVLGCVGSSCKKLKLELCFTAIIVGDIVLLSVTSKWHAAAWHGVAASDVWDPASTNYEVSEISSLFAIVSILALIGQVVPIRTRILWVAFLVGSLANPLQTAIIGSSIENEQARWGNNFTLVIIGIFSFVGARRREFQLRTNWRAKVDAEEREIYTQGLQSMSWLSCEVVIRLCPDGFMRNPSPEQESFFAQKLDCQRLADFVADNCEAAFKDLLQLAQETGTAQSMPISLRLQVAEVQAQMVALCVSGSSVKYIIGVSEVERRPLGATEAITLSMEQPDALTSVMAPSIATTGFSDLVFNDIDRLCSSMGTDITHELRKNLEKVAKMGINEHWLIGTGEIALFPSLLLGEGAFGQVVTGRARGALVAVKLPKRSGDGASANPAKVLGSFINELRLLRRIRNPNIVAFYGASLDPLSGDVAMIFEYVPGFRMGAFVGSSHKTGHAREHRGAPMAAVLFDIGMALVYLHTLEPTVVHGDLKESNIKVYQCQEHYHQAKLLDFGLSRLSTKKSKPLGGTTPWRAPELFRSDEPPRPATSADVFSFGILMHFTMTGIPVWDSFDQTDVTNRFQRLAWPEGTPLVEECRRCCADALSPSPDRRRDMKHFVEELAGWLRESGAGFERLGFCRVQFLAEADSWDVGIKQLRGAHGQQESQSTAAPSNTTTKILHSL